MMEKISAAQVDYLLIKSAGVIRAQAERIRELEEQVAVRDRRDYAEKIAHVAVTRGLMDEDEAGDYAEQLAAGTQDLSMVEDFVGRAATGIPLGRTLEKSASEDNDSGRGGMDALTYFLHTGEHLAG